MRILILGMNYAPELTGIAPFTTALARHLAGRGHAVTVATTFPHYPAWEVAQEYRGQLWTSETADGVKVRRMRVHLPRAGSGFSRILYDSSFALAAATQSFTVGRQDCVLSVSPPLQGSVVGGLLARVWRCPHIISVQDLPLDAALSLNLLRSGLAVSIATRLERLAFQLATRAVVISPGFKRRLVEIGVSPDKVEEIPNWADVERFGVDSAGHARELLRAAPSDFLLVHIGNMGRKQGLETAVRAAVNGSSSTWRLALVGDGSERRRLEAMVASMPEAAVSMLPLQPDAMIPRILSAADALLVTQRADVTDSVAPSKMLSYMAAGRPVIAAVHPRSEAAALVTRAACGVVVVPESSESLADAVLALKEDPVRCSELGAAGRKYALEHFSKESVYELWRILVEGLDSSR